MLSKDEIKKCSILLGCKVSPALLDRAFTHVSYANEKHTESNERLEFLGDSVLGMVVAEYLYKRYPGKDEGVYTKVKSRAVSGEALAAAAKRMGITSMLKAEDVLGNNRTRLYANLFEALVGAVYIDKGLSSARFFILRELQPFIDELMNGGFLGDYKSELGMFAQKNHAKLDFVLTGQSGPPHEPVFEMAAVLDGVEVGRGKGGTKLKAQENAAEQAYFRIFKNKKDSDRGSM